MNQNQTKFIAKIDWEKGGGLVPGIIQDVNTSRVLMLGYLNQESLEKTFSTGKVWFYSRSKQRLWMKGEESKNYLYFKRARCDCDGDVLLISAQPAGPTCHTNATSCFDVEQLEAGEKKPEIGVIAELAQVIATRKKKMPAGSYTTELFQAGSKKICEKIMEEAGEVCQAITKESKQRVVEESVDLIYHLLVGLVERGVSLDEILEEIKRRRK
ncbi:bifunctional phosphoribosyl-AMP cyclohydrolase/phosphoribosyl-ATP diphosphatase HisIE [Patescibacteria group bacterium]|nr:bifunctional phosphoribosyl-AMP cyclohydrolase/phosphoribosyl-ATP diphosphatase HisIE [Patescibacteria group bacterium]